MSFEEEKRSIIIFSISWIILSMLLGISYTTIYASRLASPSYEKPINTVRQIVENGLSICNAYFDISTMEPFLASSNPDYKELANRSIVYGENTQQRRRLFVERKCAIFEVRFTKYYLSLLKFEADLDLLPLFRTINNCITNHYTGFVFQKYSPFTKLFNWHIRRYQEHGINKKWHSEILQTPEYMKTIFQDFPEGDKSHHSIAFISVSGAFFLLGTGLFVSSVAFFVEYMPRVNSRNA